MKRLLLTLAISASGILAQDASSPVTLIHHVTVINVVTGEEAKEQTVKLQGGRILSVASTEPSDGASPGAVDAHGGFLIPGLWDMHVHIHETGELPLYIANGVTGVRMMAGERDTAALRVELSEKKPSPFIYLASAIVDGSSPMWPGSIVVKKPADARHTVDDIKAGGADFIKVYDGVPRDAYFALADEAKLQHIDFEGHVPEAITAQEASAAGQRSIEHLTGIALACSSKQESLNAAIEHARFFLDRLRVEAEGYRSFNQAKCQTLFAEFRQNDTWQVPTLTVNRMWGRLDDSKMTSDPRLVYVGRKSRSRWDERTQPQIRRWNNSDYQMARGIFGVDEKIVGGLYRAGVPLLAGTDAMNPYCLPGFSLHDELALMVDSGLSPLAALQTATINPARFLHRTSELGSVEAGKSADLVLLRADPLADIHNTTQIEAVWLHGQYFDHAAILGLLEAAKLEAKH
ncbi:amidohydrolase family protein [Granulicella arctica]|uniref:amidohydrolase family protein n=1 Tax=Granulicella arctica TaxID=940613 RepID=UPI0021E0925C|nr:amidohydrolase family protein [Granulicella arctica]